MHVNPRLHYRTIEEMKVSGFINCMHIYGLSGCLLWHLPSVCGWNICRVSARWVEKQTFFAIHMALVVADVVSGKFSRNTLTVCTLEPSALLPGQEAGTTESLGIMDRPYSIRVTSFSRGSSRYACVWEHTDPHNKHVTSQAVRTGRTTTAVCHACQRR